MNKSRECDTMNEKTSSTLFSLFDRQRFDGDPHLAALIRDTERRWCEGDNALSDDDLELVSAAGTPELMKLRQDEEQRL